MFAFLFLFEVEGHEGRESGAAKQSGVEFVGEWIIVDARLCRV